MKIKQNTEQKDEKAFPNKKGDRVGYFLDRPRSIVLYTKRTC